MKVDYSRFGLIGWVKFGLLTTPRSRCSLNLVEIVKYYLVSSLVLIFFLPLSWCQLLGLLSLLQRVWLLLGPHPVPVELIISVWFRYGHYSTSCWIIISVWFSIPLHIELIPLFGLDMVNYVFLLSFRIRNSIIESLLIYVFLKEK